MHREILNTVDNILNDKVDRTIQETIYSNESIQIYHLMFGQDQDASVSEWSVWSDDLIGVGLVKYMQHARSSTYNMQWLVYQNVITMQWLDSYILVEEMSGLRSDQHNLTLYCSLQPAAGRPLGP